MDRYTDGSIWRYWLIALWVAQRTIFNFAQETSFSRHFYCLMY